ncbi:class I SAM-dependent methyltransferase [Nonomuraea sp. SMC257]|uniref:Class I SAM-dependent methyltransferase n=1 Tax=Nonomuraea montanisoli TaxID=2741721 RepID=A0A7Y6IEV9_9ACTN|nr:class I SAM-dependent methyltransferase [Nonomuraea montanisoli]NUW37005.1 class I SAM-dependent methyltransferase [Nonomuraea montanisoli]
MTEPDFLHTTQASYDAIAAQYEERFHDELAAMPLERAMLAAFAELVAASGGGPVADVGCGAGHVTAHLHGLGLSAVGMDLSPRMVALARREHFELRFEEGSMTALDLPDGTLGGVVAMYSIIHVPDERLPDVFAEFHRVLAPGGQVLLAFQVGDDHVRQTEAFGQQIALDCYWRPLEHVADLLGRAGFVENARLVREPDGTAKLQRACLLARRPASTRHVLQGQ